MSIEFQEDFAFLSLFIVFGISFALYFYKMYSRRKKTLKHLNQLFFLLILTSCFLYLFNSLFSISYISTNGFKNPFPFLTNLLILFSIFISIYLYFNILVLFNKESVKELKNDKLNGNNKAENLYKKICKFFKKRIYENRLIKKATLNDNLEKNLATIDNNIKPNLLNEYQSLEELKKLIKSKIKEENNQNNINTD